MDAACGSSETANNYASAKCKLRVSNTVTVLLQRANWTTEILREIITEQWYSDVRFKCSMKRGKSNSLLIEVPLSEM